MRNVTVNKDELLSILRTNLAKHRDIFLEAQDAYRAQMIKELDGMLDDARHGRRIRRAVQIPEPEEHSGDYEQAIQMLEMEVGNTVELDYAMFRQFVRDEWGWQAQFLMNTTRYTSASIQDN